MNSSIFTFSTKTKEDTDFVNKIKIRAARSGRTFSYTVLQALKEAEDSRNAKQEQKDG